MKTIIAYALKKPPPRKIRIKVVPLLKITATFQTKTLENWTQHMDMSTEKNVMHDEQRLL
ncbi:hypothetical protein HanRHA438_Chr08g0365521 [Helianthus annuus]|uniref:Uncharacterized protein n=1 Tax=Helianthus annuus TaxID=4232 RepID=A0A9K3NEL7_HELAN|nr:hypothetical protein HanXRQr2_Chr08g0353281 [Helianthus annuus]KAJ0548203.1 hypothetical protein HanIR_Chr08g0380981 [Helianthus annuus]KAJ0554610.1 hypothetical protein HanHA89_Chr08g0309961 [Helianthus annuus]KAJ0720172.1 hypothetical protein HanLR1_Chr08g0290271 [Helianthus annuus]KAJ0723401.1 hypothetical protein HanOQP8_Chr08g0297791 [Helianthus annuus]